MSEHAEAVLAEVRQRIVNLKELELGLLSYMCPPKEAEEAFSRPEVLQKGAKETKKAGRQDCGLHRIKDLAKGKPAVNHRGTKAQRGISETGPYPELQAVARVLQEPFGMAELAEAGKVNKKAASNALVRWSAGGWLKRVGHGQYSRSAKFGIWRGEVPKLGTRGTRPSEEDPGAAGSKLLADIHREIDGKRGEERE